LDGCAENIQSAGGPEAIDGETDLFGGYVVEVGLEEDDGILLN
jgi:hypothetical protein